MRQILFLLLLTSQVCLGSGFWGTSSGGGGGTGNILTVNGDATAAQTLSTGTTGTDFAIVDNAAGDHSFNLPTASATARGLVSTGAQTIAGVKTFSSAPIHSALTASQAVVTDGSKALASLAYTSANTASALVQRDGSGNFSAGTITANLTGNASGTAATITGNLTGAVTSTGMTTTQVLDWTGHVETASNKSYIIDFKPPYGGTINLLDIACNTSGTATVAVKIAGTSVTGISAVSVSSTPATGTASAANTFTAGQQILLVVSSNSSCLDLAWTIKYTR